MVVKKVNPKIIVERTLKDIKDINVFSIEDLVMRIIEENLIFKDMEKDYFIDNWKNIILVILWVNIKHVTKVDTEVVDVREEGNEQIRIVLKIWINDLENYKKEVVIHMAIVYILIIPDEKMIEVIVNHSITKKTAA